MPRQTIRAYFGFEPPRHRRGHGSRSIRVVSGTAIIVVLLGLAFTLLHHNSKGSPGPSTLPASNSTTTQPRSSSTTSTTTAGQSTTTTIPTTTLPSTSTSTSTSTTLPSVSPTSVLVEVINGSGASGQATSVSTALRADGFQINGTGDAPSYDFTSSVIDYPAGLFAAAQTLGRYINGSVVFHESSTVPAGEVQLTTGSSFTSVAGT